MTGSSRILIPTAIALAAISLAGPARAQSNRLKELVAIEGFRSNSLVGYGIVVGLNGTGDDARSPIVRKSLANMLKRLGVTIDPDEIKAKNVAAVVVTAELPAFARSGARIAVTVSSMGSAKTLQGGTLIATPLKGADLETYAIAQGPLSLGAFAVEGASGSKAQKNHPTVGRIPTGATVERDAPNVLPRREVVLLLKEPDFTTASRIAKAIDKTFSAPTASVRDPGAVTVAIHPEWRKHAVHFIATIESIEAVADAPARVIIDERTGTVVVGEHVRLGKAAIAHGALTVTISESEQVAQPAPLAAGDTAITRTTEISVSEADGPLDVVGPGSTVGDVAAALNALGAKPRDLVSIFQALHAAGALRAEVHIL